MITERKALSDSPTNIEWSVFASALNQVEQAILIVDCTNDDFIISWANAAAVESRSSSELPIIGLPWHVCFPESPEGSDLTILKQVHETGRLFESDDSPLFGFTDYFESESSLRSAYWKWRYVPITGPDGIKQILVVGSNITQAVNKAKRDDEERMVGRLLAKGLGSASVSIMYFGTDLRLKWLNSGALTFLGQPLVGIAGRHLAEVLPHLGQRIEDHVRHVLVSGRSLSVDEFPCSLPNGGNTFWALTYAPINGLEGKAGGVLATGIEVTKQVVRRRKSEDAAVLARLTTSQLEVLIESMKSAVVITDAKGQQISANRLALAMLGLPGGAQSGSTFGDYLLQLNPRLLDGSPLSSSDLPIASALTVGGFADFEFEVTVPGGGERILSLTGTPVRGERDVIVMGVFLILDVTEQKMLDHLKDEFLATAAHELKTPVAVMKGFAQIIARSSADYPPEHRKALEAIDRNANRIDSIIGDLLDASALQSGALKLRMERLNLSDLVAEVADGIARATDSHRIEVHLSENIAIQGDGQRLENVLFNLIDNAIRYSPKGGEITIWVLERDGEAVFSVNDSGVGIPKLHHRHIFERFYRAHSGTPYDYGGIGIGLFISKEIIALHGGRMWFESEEGKGSTFYFSLPSLEGKKWPAGKS